MKLDVKAFTVAVSLLWGLGVFFLTLWMLLFDTAAAGEQTLIGKIYLGYTVSGAGAMIGLVWGLVDGLLGGAIFALLYNFLVDRFGASPARRASDPADGQGDGGARSAKSGSKKKDGDKNN